ncbi:methyltransferase domain-containing protein [Paraburkholderia sp. DHOC27]|uniref:methyltransferase domain-containing protein n=1 Tax=Paraburkholderia sp. DHOC27 TaxID=2303330 RepID=UPI0015F32892|nr:methyltransferase domain-containing protein [Paraburkholderia sp. DHOC27]
MATVSILIPAFKADFLVKALASAQTQTFKDVEILIGDDTADGHLKDIVARFDDPRIQYFHHGFQDGFRNSQRLWERASGTYVKWLFDDDILMPTSVEALVNALRKFPESALAFHDRAFIDGNDKVISVPPTLITEGEMALIDRPLLAREMVAKLGNFVGEPSNILLVREKVDISTVMNYRDQKLDFLADVGMYLNLAERAPLVAVRGHLSCFRQHSGQQSGQSSPIMSAGFYEWEMFVRGEAAAGNLPESMLPEARDRIKVFYTHAFGNLQLKEIEPLLANLDEITDRPAAGLFESARFQADIANARAIVDARRRAARVSNFCAVCEQTVGAWLPHPLAGTFDVEFLTQVEGVGSRLDKHICPKCHCNDRDRHLWLYLTRSGVLDNLQHKRVLHLAPEGMIEPRIRALQPLDYIAGDLHPRLPHHRKINVEALDFPNGRFDLIICNHVLEHVDDPERALAEFRRCLAPDGHLVAQTPYSPVLKYTFELNRPPTTPFAIRYFGQDDHVRLFGANMPDLFRAAGLNGDLYPHATVLGDTDPEKFGVNGQEPFFLFVNGVAPRFEQAADNASAVSVESEAAETPHLLA